MSKNTEIKFVGQPIFKQIVNLTDAVNIESSVRKHNSDCYYKAFKSRTHLISMLDVSELLRSTNRSYQVARGSPKDIMQLILEFKEENEGDHFEI